MPGIELSRALTGPECHAMCYAPSRMKRKARKSNPTAGKNSEDRNAGFG
jgi:hypothetical protein